MEEFIWDGEMDCGWEDLAVKVKTESIKFTEVMLETVSYSPTKESRELISNESMKRFCLLAERVADEIENGYYYQCEDLEDNAPNACKLTSWIILGSLTETALQIFLAFYIVDYKNVHWQQWLDFPEAEVREKVNGTISKLVKDEVITGAQGKSLKNAIKETIKKHCVEHQVQKFMLDEIIQFYKEQGLMDEEDIQFLKVIQSNRNGIHSFENRVLGDWNNLQYAVRFWCYLLEWILIRLPDIPDYE